MSHTPGTDEATNHERPDDEPGSARRPRRERVLHTRISQHLSEEIRRVAEDLRVPVSNLVRNVLEEAFDAVEQVSENVGDLVEGVLEEAERARERFARRGAARRRHWREEREPADAGPPQDERSSPPPPAPRMEFAGVVGWQPIVLDVAARCAVDDRSLERGQDAWVGVGAQGSQPIILCRSCMEARRAAG